MYAVSSDVAEAIAGSCRNFKLAMTNVAESIKVQDIISADSDAQSTSKNSDIEFGAVCSSQWTLSVYNPENKKFLGSKFKLSLCLKELDGKGTTWGDLHRYTYGEIRGMSYAELIELGTVIGGEYIPMGEFTCIRSKRSGDQTDLTLCDALYKADNVYVPRVTLPAMASAVEDDICAQLGVENGNSLSDSSRLSDKFGRRMKTASGQYIKVQGYDFRITSIAKDTTMRQMLGYIAACVGQFGFIDRFGKYRRKWYGAPVMTLDNNTLNVTEMSERANTITGIICHTGDTTRQYGDSSGRVIEFDDPYMTDQLFLGLWHRIQMQRLEWYTAEIDHVLGDPRLDIGDVVVHNDGTAHTVPITSLSFSYDGGLSAQLKAAGIDVEEQIGGI